MLVMPLGGLLAQVSGYGQVAGHLIGTPSGLLALAAAALTCVIAGMLARAARTPHTMIPLRGRATALRARSRRTAFIRQRDPDAAGHSRPRAPTASQAAA